ncbi:MAG: hypothetical protein BGP04_25130 [Rhizobiales bacterium 62-17]|jgi:hypothetical protein|nr:hypothetical protein [Hyphomicrobiales bacterium]OJY00785.1 MAG: hypothetical protein BGP04_25130 [Rhizobiales bacterium 62-17]
MTKEKCEPITSLICSIRVAGSDLIESAGFLKALWYARDLGNHDEKYQIEEVRKAIAKATAALDQYESVTNAEMAA